MLRQVCCILFADVTKTIASGNFDKGTMAVRNRCVQAAWYRKEIIAVLVEHSRSECLNKC